MFHPAIPKHQAEVMSLDSGFRMGNLTHVVVQFESVWWNNDLRKWLAPNRGSNESEAGGPDGGGPNAAGALRRFVTVVLSSLFRWLLLSAC